jgi:hypothetical protein
VDLGISADGDACGIAMGHIEEVKEVDGEKKPYIVIDCLIRIKAMAGTEIMISDVRRWIYYMKEELGFRIISVSIDGFQSTDTMQQMRKKRYVTEYLSTDKSTLPYEDTREAIYDERLEFPPYLTYLNKGDTELVEIAVKELSELVFDGKKVDHTVTGSKDVSDGIAGVVNTLMGDRKYRKGVTSLRSTSDEDDDYLQATGTTGQPGSVIPFPGTGNGLQAPLPPLSGGSFGLTLPQRLQPKPRRDR